LTEDRYEAQFKHEGANNIMIRNQICCGTKNAIISNQRAACSRLGNVKSKPSTWGKGWDKYIEPTIHICRLCGTEHWKKNLKNLVEKVKDREEFATFMTTTPEFYCFQIGRSDHIRKICPFGEHH